MKTRQRKWETEQLDCVHTLSNLKYNVITGAMSSTTLNAFTENAGTRPGQGFRNGSSTMVTSDYVFTFQDMIPVSLFSRPSGRSEA